MYLCENLASLVTAFAMTSQETRVNSAMIANAGIETKAAKRNPGSHSLVEVRALELRGARKVALEIMGFLKLH
jgi:hypothetical protein